MTDDQNDVVDEAQQEEGAAPDELAKVSAERDDYLLQLKSTLADFQNYRRRQDQERERIREIANTDLLRSILPVMDDLQRAVAALPEDQRHTGWGEGTAAVERKFIAVLERFGVSRTDAVGQPFDPAQHEAVTQVPGSSGSHVAEVFVPGYRIGQSLLRPAMVMTGDAPTEAEQEQPE